MTRLLALLLLAADPETVELPAGTRFCVRLERAVSAHASSPGDPVKATLVAPVAVDGRVAVPAGWSLRGSVRETGLTRGRDRRARLLLVFSQLAGNGADSFPISARVTEVDNARESVDADGRILGMPMVKKPPQQTEARLQRAADLDPVALGLLEQGSGALGASVWFDPGVELVVELTRPARVPLLAGTPRGDDELTLNAELRAALSAVPARAHLAGQEGVAAEPVNVLLLAAREALEAALTGAGWRREGDERFSTAVSAFASLAAKNGYAPGPAAQLALDTLPPDLVYDKRVNSLARGYRLRLWKRAGHRGTPIWAGVVTRETRLELRADKTYAYGIDARVDDARAKLRDDLAFAGKLRSAALVDRKPPASPARSGSGAAVETDGRIAVILLR